MEACNECLRLEQRLRTASEDYVDLIVQHDQMMRDGNSEASTLDLISLARFNTPSHVCSEFLWHRGTHEDLSLPKKMTAGQL